MHSCTATRSSTPSTISRGWPTPTVLVDGRDLFGLLAPATPSMGCRVYPDGVPEANDIAEKLKSEAGR